MEHHLRELEYDYLLLLYEWFSSIGNRLSFFDHVEVDINPYVFDQQCFPVKKVMVCIFRTFIQFAYAYIPTFVA